MCLVHASTTQRRRLCLWCYTRTPSSGSACMGHMLTHHLSNHHSAPSAQARHYPRCGHSSCCTTCCGVGQFGSSSTCGCTQPGCHSSGLNSTDSSGFRLREAIQRASSCFGTSLKAAHSQGQAHKPCNTDDHPQQHGVEGCPVEECFQ